MIRRLRWKVVAVTMAVVTAVLLGAMTTVFLASRASLESQSREQLRQALQGDAFAPGAPDRAAGRTFVAEVFAGGTVRVSESVFQDLGDEETVLAVINDCLARQEDSGLLPDYDLRYLRQVSPLSIRIAFADSTMERTTLRSMLGTVALVGAAAFLALLGLSYLLSGFVTRPVDEAWRRQQQFLSDASHELKTPLTVIMSSADLLAETAPDSAGSKSVTGTGRTTARPTDSRNTKFTAAPARFLSESMASQIALSPPSIAGTSERREGSERRRRSLSTREDVPGSVTPEASPILAAATMPTATASPWATTPYPRDFSTACPTVCPKFSSMRRPPSRSSRDTTSAFMAAHVRTTRSMSSGVIGPSGGRVSSHAKKSASRMQPHFTTSAMPWRNSRGGSVRKRSGSSSTATGW